MLKSTIYCITILLLLASCREDYSLLVPENVVTEKEEGDISRLFSTLKGQGQSFTLIPENGASFVLSSGVQVIVPEDAFLAPDSEEFAAEDISIEIVEMDKKVDFIAREHSMLSNENEIIVSQVTLLINPTINGQRLETAEGKEIEILLPDFEPHEGMHVYNIPSESVANKWVQINDEWLSFEVLNNYLSLRTNVTGWLTCGYVLEGTEVNSGDINVEMAEEYDDEDTAVFLTIAPLNTVIRLDNANVAGAFGLQNIPNLPMNASAKIVAISNQNETIYHFKEQIEIIEENNEWQMSLKPSAIDLIEEALDAL